MESQRAASPRAGGAGVLTLDIKQHFISYYGVTTTSYKCSFQKNAILKRWAVKHIILILYTADHRVSPAAASGSHKLRF